MEITVANVAGLIAAMVFIAHQLSPNALALILSRLVQDQTTAATWTVTSAALQQSYWPLLLRTDSSFSHGVPRHILWVVRMFPAIGILLAVSSVVSPLGLYSAKTTGNEILATFEYAADPSSFGYGTSLLMKASWSRVCGFIQRPCPYSNEIQVTTTFPNGTTTFNTTTPSGADQSNITLPSILQEIFSSGTASNSTISNSFDIRWRRQKTIRLEYRNSGNPFAVAGNRNIRSLVLDNAILVVEGLVVDAVNGGVGFRNHTVPLGLKHGATWVEDLLFIEPETSCVDTNLTLDYTVENTDLSASGALFLTDRGGFVNLNKTHPDVDYEDDWRTTRIYQSAYRAAWKHNTLTAFWFNVSNPPTSTSPPWSFLNSAMNKSLKIRTTTANPIELQTLVMSHDFGLYLAGAYDVDLPSTMSPNPWAIGWSNYSSINSLCVGAGEDDIANITNVIIGCGLMRGVPQRTDSGSQLEFDIGSNWSQKIFACATGIKASIKTVTFSYNRTDGQFESLAVVDAQPKTYPNQASMPLWGVEDTGGHFFNNDLNLIWGLVSDVYEKALNVSTVRQPHLYLPGWFDGTTQAESENLPVSDLGTMGLAAVYMPTGVVDYTGQSSLAMWIRWQQLTANAGTASLIPNLIFTDALASAVVGTKKVRNSGDSVMEGAFRAPVLPVAMIVRYHWQFGIPAFITLVMLLTIGISILALLCTGGLGIKKLKERIQRLSPGRIFTVYLFQEETSFALTAKEWSKRDGEKQIDLAGEAPTAVHGGLSDTDAAGKGANDATVTTRLRTDFDQNSN